MRTEWRFDHIVMVVKDIESTFNFYKCIGFEAFLDPVYGAVKDCKIYGEMPETTHSFKVAYVRKDSLLLKIVQPLEGDSVYKEYLEKHGEGIARIHFYVEDIAQAKKDMEEKGVPVIFEVGHHTHSELHFDSRELGGNTIIELRQGSYIKQLK